ncbi:MAG TPA: GNAT family N-acetyltransferase [Solirubrobacteraceae bacterium]|nr:GNAT family N-acetyltransferase [Solirubrobacteraceae bacterium]
MPATIADCERLQTEWNVATALAGGGSAWEDEGLAWAWQPHSDHLMLNFPTSIDAAAAQRGVEFAREHGARIIGAWLSTDVDASPLEAVGFDRGWEPWWMAAGLDLVADGDDPRVSLSADVPEYGPGGQRLLSLTRSEPCSAWHAVARVEGQFAGRAWSLMAGEVAGIYDMDVWPAFQRQGLGRALLRSVCAAARAGGATRAVLNATPDGERLYSAEGFVRLGAGITYWHHLEG